MDLFITKNSHQLFYWLFALIVQLSNSLGFDSANYCSSNGKYARQSRAQILNTIPCDLTTQAYCNMPGSAYPWNAVRRFVHENQGLMKRMYGDVRHITILRDEIQDNEIHVEDLTITKDWYTRDRLERSLKLKPKTEFFGSRLKDALPEPHFRPATAQTSPISSVKTKTKQESKPSLKHLREDDLLEMSTRPLVGELGHEGLSDSGESIFQHEPSQENSEIENNSTTVVQRSKESTINQTTPSNDEKLDEQKSSANDKNDEASSPSTQTVVFVGDNIEIVESPRLGLSNITTTTSNPQEIAIATTTAPIPETTVLELDGNLLNQSDASPEETSLQDPHQNTQNIKPIIDVSQKISVSDEAPQMKSGVSENLAKQTGTRLEQPSSITPMKPIIPAEQPNQGEMKKESPPVFNTRGINACPVKEEVVAPFWANNTRGEILALLNLYPFEQYVHWEKCTFEYKQMYCREGCRCEQQYRLHRLLAYDPHNECRGIFSDWFRFPSCCICKCYDFSYDFTASSRNAKVEREFQYDHHFKAAEANVKNAIYAHATEDWYRPKDDFDLNGG